MADVQKEHGYTPIANEILDEIIKLNLNGTQWKIIVFVWRYTYGYSRKSHEISETLLSRATGVAKQHISREIQPLFERNILIKVEESTFSKPAVIMFNKDYDTWRGLPNSVTVTEKDNSNLKCAKPVTELGYSTVTGFGNHKNNIKTKKTNIGDCMCFFEELWKLYPHKKGKQAVSAKSKTELFQTGFDVIKKSIDNYMIQKPEFEHYMHGSTFFNGRWKEFISETVENEPVKEKTKKRENY